MTTAPGPLVYQLNEEDYLAHHLFSDSQNERLRKKRTTRRFIIPVLYTLLGIFLLLGESYPPAILFFVVGLLYMFFYPEYSLWIHQRHYKKHVRDQYQNKINKTAMLQLSAEELLIKDDGNELKMKTSELARLSETVTHYFLRTKSNSVVIIPKHSITDQANLQNVIDFLRNSLKVPYHDALNWRWK